MFLPSKDKVQWNLSQRFVDYVSKDKVINEQVIDKEHPNYKYEYPETIHANIMSALFKNPLTDQFDVSFSQQGYGFCANIEYRAMNCLEAYGLPQSYKKCADFLEDMYECSTREKAYKRVEVMREERSRQARSGERKMQYSPPPRIGTYMW